jgi:hypothetical protein
MGDLDTKMWIEAAQSYWCLRRRYLRFTLAFVGSFIGFAALFVFASAKNLDALAGVLFLVFIPASCVVGLGTILTSLDLLDFRCPRCARRFAMSWRGGYPTDRCKHCGLDLGSALRAAKKPQKAADLLE